MCDVLHSRATSQDFVQILMVKSLDNRLLHDPLKVNEVKHHTFVARACRLDERAANRNFEAVRVPMQTRTCQDGSVGDARFQR